MIIANNTLEAAIDCDAIIVMTEWQEFKEINWESISSVMRSPSWLFDTRSICNLKEAKNHKMNIWSIGNGK